MRYLILLLLLSSASYGQMSSFSGKYLDKFLQVQMKSLDMPDLSIAVIKNGRIIYHRALGVDKQAVFEADPLFAHLAGDTAKLYTEAAGYARFLVGLMKDKTKEEMFKAQTSVPQNYKEGVVALGSGMEIRSTKYGMAYQHGGSKCNFLFYKEKRTGYVFFTNCNKKEAFNERLQIFLEML